MDRGGVSGRRRLESQELLNRPRQVLNANHIPGTVSFIWEQERLNWGRGGRAEAL